MKTSLLLLAAGSLLLASCDSRSDSASTGTHSPTNRIDVTLDKSDAHSPHDNKPDPDSRQVTWTLQNNADPALTNKVYALQVVEWHFTNKFFLYIDENSSHVTNWETCTDPTGNPLPWITTNTTPALACPFDKPNHRALCANPKGGDWVVSMVFPTDATSDRANIPYRLITGDCPAATTNGNARMLSATYDYYMLEATLVWDSSGLRHDSNVPPK